MSESELAELETARIVAPKRPDPAAVARLLRSTRRDIELSQEIAQRFPKRALTIAYEASLRACAGILDLSGYRVRSQQGHHAAFIRATRVVLGEPFATVLMRVDIARGYRNDDLYGSTAPPSAAQRDEAIADAVALADELERRLAHLSG